MTTAESDAIFLLTRIRDSVGNIAGQWEQAKALLYRVSKREVYGGWPSREIAELITRIDAGDASHGFYGGVGTQGAREIAVLLRQIQVSGVVTGGGGGGGPTQMLNAEKLSLSPATAVGTQVSVTDAFVLHENGEDYFYYTNGTEPSGGTAPAIEKYTPTDTARVPANGNLTWRWNNANDSSDGGAWGDAQGNYAGLGDASVTHFWDTPIEVIDHTYTITHPIVQVLVGPSTAQGGVFVSGGTQPGIYPITDSFFGNPRYAIGGDTSTYNIRKNDDPISWQIRNDAADGVIYYSLSDVATPDLAVNWKNASDDSPASITVTSVSAGDIAAGLQYGGNTYVVNGAQNGRNLYHDVLGVEQDIGWDGGGAWQRAVPPFDFENLNFGNVAFPWQGTPEVTITKSDVAVESNWTVVP